MNEKLQSLQRKWATVFADWFGKLSGREKVLFLGACLFILGMGVYQGVDTIQQTLTQQEIKAKDLANDLAGLPLVLERYQKLQQRLSATEDYYKSIVLTDGRIDSYLESLYQDKVGSTDRKSFSIDRPTSSTFADNYTRQSRKVTVREVTEFDKLVDYLDTLISGEKPLLLSTLRLIRSRRGDRLTLEMVVDSIQRSKDR